MSHNLSLRCASCGAPLTVPPELKQFTCRYCGTEQQVVADGDVLYLRSSVRAIESSTERVASELALQRLREELTTLGYRLNSCKRELEEAERTVAVFTAPLPRTLTEPPTFSLSKYTGVKSAGSFLLIIFGFVFFLACAIATFSGVFARIVSSVLLFYVFFFWLLHGWRKFAKEAEEFPQLKASAEKSNLEIKAKYERTVQDLRKELSETETKIFRCNEAIDHHTNLVGGVS